MTAEVDAVRAYYDRNTAVFERLGEGGASIHRAVWLPGVASRADAFRSVDRLVASGLSLPSGGARVLDLGCGLGESLRFLCSARPGLAGVGVTLSGVQAASAAARSPALTFVQADIQRLPALGVFDGAYAIESFVHCPDTAGFFASAAAQLRPGGRLVVVDDFLARPARPGRERRWLDDVRDGWLGFGLCAVSHAVSVASAHGLSLVAEEDLTPWLELRRPRDHAVSLLLSITRPLRLRGAYLGSLAGGDALQRALIAGVLGYRVLTFQR
ncbi:MAG TPA: methyltransferase domain-containing protein [Dermatophilaceae bacterium]|nr:methyltransferase domain-containing protein [Dermatophilaceae bacterium]